MRSSPFTRAGGGFRAGVLLFLIALNGFYGGLLPFAFGTLSALPQAAFLESHRFRGWKRRFH